MKKKNITRSLTMMMLTMSLAGCGSATSSQASGNSASSASSFDTSKTIKCYTRDTTSGTRDGFFSTIGMKEQKENNAGLVSGFLLALPDRW